MSNEKFGINIGTMVTSASEFVEFHLHLTRNNNENDGEAFFDALISDRVICPFTSESLGDTITEAIAWAKFLNIEFILEDKFKYPLKINGKSYTCPYGDYAKTIYDEYLAELREQREPRRIMVDNVDMTQDWEATMSLSIPYTDMERAEKNGGFFFAQYTQECEKGIISTYIRTREMESAKLISIDQVDFKDNYLDMKDQNVFARTHPASEFLISAAIFTYKNRLGNYYVNNQGETNG